MMWFGIWLYAWLTGDIARRPRPPAKRIVWLLDEARTLRPRRESRMMALNTESRWQRLMHEGSRGRVMLAEPRAINAPRREEDMGTFPTKDPAEVLDYGVLWRDLIGSDKIATSAWTVEADNAETPVALAVVNPVKDDTTTSLWLTGGTDGVQYTLRNTIVTQGGRTFRRSFGVNVLLR